jgi:hypothetical protein
MLFLAGVVGFFVCGGFANKRESRMIEIKGIRSSSVRQYGVVVKCQSHKRRVTDNRPW